MVGGGWSAYPFTFSPELVMQREDHEHWVTVNFKLPWNFPFRNFRKTAERTAATRFPGRSISSSWKPRKAKIRRAKSEPVHLSGSFVFSILVLATMSLLNRRVSISNKCNWLAFVTYNRHEIGAKLHKSSPRKFIFIVLIGRDSIIIKSI